MFLIISAGYCPFVIFCWLFFVGYFLQCIGQVGKVKGFATNGDAIVSFGNKKYRLDPGALKKVRRTCVWLCYKYRIMASVCVL